MGFLVYGSRFLVGSRHKQETGNQKQETINSKFFSNYHAAA